MGPQLAALARQDARVKLRIVDVVRWDSPVARQYRIERLPTLWLYEDGALVSKDSRAIAERLSALK
jgi:hypothetical protein